MGDETLTADRGIGRSARMVEDRAGASAALAMGRPLTDDQLMADLLRVYYQGYYRSAVIDAYTRSLGGKTERKRARSASSLRLRARLEAFLRVEEPRLLPTLERFGWSHPRAVDRGYIAQLEDALNRWANARYDIVIPPPDGIDFDPAVVAQLPSGMFIGPESSYLAHLRDARVQRAMQTLQNIASGPLATAGFFIAGDTGSDVGAMLDEVASFGGAVASKRAEWKDLSTPPDQRAVAAIHDTPAAERGLDSPRTAGGAGGPRAPIGPPPPPEPPPPPTGGGTGGAGRGGGPPRDPYKQLQNKELKKLALTDPGAADALWGRYQAMPRKELAERARRGDETARAVRDQLVPSNEEALLRAEASKRTTHFASALARTRTGEIIYRNELSSANETPEEKAEAPIGLAAHTERRFLKEAPLKPGVTLSIIGQYDPCGPCMKEMQAAATRTRATITYWWPGEGSPSGWRVMFVPDGKGPIFLPE